MIITSFYLHNNIGISDEIRVARIFIDNVKKQTDDHIAILIKADRVNIFALRAEN